MLTESTIVTRDRDQPGTARCRRRREQVPGQPIHRHRPLNDRPRSLRPAPLVPPMCHLRAKMIIYANLGACAIAQTPRSGAEARGFEPRMGVNPNRISSPFPAPKADITPPRSVASAQVNAGIARNLAQAGPSARNSRWPIIGPAGLPSLPPNHTPLHGGPPHALGTLRRP
jgi:hypothetical protein